MKNKWLSSLMPHLNLCVCTLIFLFQTTSCVDQRFLACEPKKCGNHTIKYPFYIGELTNSSCGYPGFNISCHGNIPILRRPHNNFQIQKISYNNQSLHLLDTAILNIQNGCFPKLNNMSLETERFTILPSLSDLFLFSNCSSYPTNLTKYKIGCESEKDHGNGVGFALFGAQESLMSYVMKICQVVVSTKVDVGKDDGDWDYFAVLNRGIDVKWKAAKCSRCEASGGRCGFNDLDLTFQCFCSDRPHMISCKKANEKISVKVILAIVVGGFALIIMTILAICYRKKWKHASICISTRNVSSDPFSKADLEGGGLFLGIPVFSYAELEKATHDFSPSRELGDGGYGTVYHGKLRDGREVAVKRLYEHNYKRVAQFRNEIEILTRLRHKNLVTLYGCNSRQCRELLLVYEYIPNGTVADHLHGSKAKDEPLTWPIRINIAIETACALAYLHKSDIVHRDVKTTNILLDTNFCVKVADFGLSRLLPNDVTHVSTAPQGTPGYVDPEYHQCYQLTDKSDVYSFGVVLIELVSSLPAVDISRHRYEINLANLAMNKIQNRTIEELIDPSLGFKSDPSVERMITTIVEVAFRCLQLEKEMRPSMDEVLDTLREIRDYKDDKNVKDIGLKPQFQSPEADHAVLLKTKDIPRSPNSVVEKWVSSSSTSLSSARDIQF